MNSYMSKNNQGTFGFSPVIGLDGFLSFQISTAEVETLLGRLPCTFRQELTGVGASLEKRWKFCGFEGIKTA